MIMESVKKIYIQCMPIQQALIKIVSFLPFILCASSFVSLNASITLTFAELTGASNIYGSRGVEISWSGSLNTDGLQGNISPSGRLLVQSSFSSLSRSKEMHFASRSSGFTIWTTTDVRVSDAVNNAFIPDPLLQVNAATQNFQYFNASPSESVTASSDFIVIGDTFGVQQTIYTDSSQVAETALLTPLGYDSGDLITGSAFMRNRTLADLRLPSLASLIANDEIFETSVNIGTDTLTYRVVPEPSIYGLIFGALIFGVIGLREFKQVRTGL
jgi:hypothetical protein